MLRLTRFLFIALMLVLLPFRGWAGNIMTVDMAATAVMQAKMANAENQMDMPADCAMHSQSSLDDAGPHCGSCDTCELCLAVANMAYGPWPASQLTRHSSPLAFDASFSSATRELNLKPPIS